MSTQAGDTPNEADGVPWAVRAQLLATEHWSPLASRSTTQGEVLTRISMFLMFTSASLVSLALVGQATRFSDTFVMLAMIVTMANGALTAVLLGTFITLLGWPTSVAVLVGSACGLAFAGASSVYGNRQYRDVWQRFAPLSPTPPGGD